MKKGRYVWSIIFDLLIIASVAFAGANYYLGFLPFEPLIGWKSLIFEFGAISAVFAVFVSLISIISDIVCLASKKRTCGFVGVLKMLSAGMALCAIVNYFALDAFLYTIEPIGWASADEAAAMLKWALDWHAPLFFTLVAPALVIIDFLFLELEPKLKVRNFLWALIPGGAYVGFMGVYSYLFVATGEKSFPNASYLYKPFIFAGAAIHKPIIVLGGGVIGLLLITLLLLAVRNAMRKAVVKEAVAVIPVEEKPVEEVVAEEKPVEETPMVEETPVVEEKPVAAPVEETPAPKKKAGKKVIILKSEVDKAREEGIDIERDDGDEAVEEAEERKEEAANKSAYRSARRVYHISRQASGKWQVKLATGERAIKLFDTQAQAIVYAKGLVKTQGGSIRIHGVSGKMRKE